MKDFTDKTAVVTGAASGMGRAFAERFAREGMKVVLADIEEPALESAVAELKDLGYDVLGLPTDVRSFYAVQNLANAALQAYGKVHVVCNNAGVAVGGPIGTVRERDWDWIIDVNLKGVVHGTEIFAPLIKSHGEGGHIVNTASMAGMVSPPGMEPYCATKFAVVAMSEGWYQQLAPANIGVSVLCPGFVKTRIHESGRARQDKYGGIGEVDPGVGDTREQAAQNVLNGIDPDIVGNRVLEAIQNGELYIFTHPAMRPFVEARFQMILAAFDAAANSPALASVKDHTVVIPTLTSKP